MCRWITKVRGVSVCGRSVYLTDAGLKLGYKGPTLPVTDFLRDLSFDLQQIIGAAIPVITEHNERKLAAEAAAATPPAGDDQMFASGMDQDEDDQDDFDDDDDCEDDRGDDC